MSLVEQVASCYTCAMADVEAGCEGAAEGATIELRDAVTTTLEGLVAAWREDAERLAQALQGEIDAGKALADHRALTATV